MSFGRQNNMARRANRPDEGFHRGVRRTRLDRTAMLEASKGILPRRSWMRRIIDAIFRRRKSLAKGDNTEKTAP
jgi:hypothetical protein